MRVSVVICEHSLDRYANCVETVDSVLGQTHSDIELVLVADGSGRVFELFEADYGDLEDVIVDRTDERSGPLESRNAGAELATGEIVAFLGDDTVAIEGWAEALVREYEQQNVGAVSGRVLPEWTAGRPEFLPEELSWLIGVDAPDGHINTAGGRNRSGSNVSFQRELFLELGGFESELDAKSRDAAVQRAVAELCTRLRLEHDREVYCGPTATVTRTVPEREIRPRRLIGRAFWEGYSRRQAEEWSPDPSATEWSFGRQLVRQWLPRRISALVSARSARSVTQLVALLFFTAVYGAGYGYGSLKHGSGKVRVRSESEDVRYRVLWLRPSRGDNISVRRERISEKLADRGVAVDIVNVTGTDMIPAVVHAITNDYDAVFGNVRLGLYVSYPLARLTSRPFVGTVSDPISDIDDLPAPLFEVLRQYEWFVLSRADATTYTYQETFEEAQSRGIGGRNLPNAVDYEMFAEPDRAVVDRAGEILTDEGIELGSNVAIYIGGFREEEYKIAQIIGAADRRPDWEFVFVGEGAARDAVEAAARERENVHYPGAFDYDLMPGFLAHATVGFCFKDAEQPLKVAEYGAAGLVVFARRGELSKRFDDDEVFFVEPTPEAIAEGLAALDADSTLADRYGSAIREHARAVSWDEIAAEYYDILKRIVRN